MELRGGGVVTREASSQPHRHCDRSDGELVGRGDAGLAIS